MIPRDAATRHGFEVLDGEDGYHDVLMSKLRTLLPGVITEDGLVDVNALQDIVGRERVTTSNQKHELRFAGKGMAGYMAGTPAGMELKAERGQSKDFDATSNVVIRGDNLDVLKILHKNYYGSVKAIYIDPPYNTGKDGFVYNDDFKKNESELVKELGLEQEMIERFQSLYGTKTHSGWLAFMYPRLKIAQELLTNDGVIFVSIGDDEVHNLKIIMDDIFGEHNFEGHIHWRRRHNQPNDLKKMIAIVAEHILVFAKNSVHLKQTGVGKVKITGKFSNPDNDSRGRWGSKPWRAGSGQGGTKYTIVTPTGKKLDGVWMGDENTFKNLLEDNRIIFPKGGTGEPRKKYFEFERINEGQAATNWWKHEVFGNNQEASDELALIFDNQKNIFSNPKPTKLLTNILDVGNCKNNDIVLDFFAGSGSTGEAVMRLNAEDGGNRKFILVQIDEKISRSKEEAIKFCTQNRLEPVISSIMIERLNRSGNIIKKEHPDVDVGYKTFSLKAKPKIMSDESQQLLFSTSHTGRTVTDTLFNMLCATGKPLDAPITMIVEGKLYEVGGEIYVLGDVDLTNYSKRKINVDGWGENNTLEQYLNMFSGDMDSGRVKIVY